MNENWKKVGVLCMTVVLGVVAISGCLGSEGPTIGTLKIVLKSSGFAGNVTVKMDDIILYEIVMTKGQTRELVDDNVTNGTHTIDICCHEVLLERKHVTILPEETTKVEFTLYDL